MRTARPGLGADMDRDHAIETYLHPDDEALFLEAERLAHRLASMIGQEITAFAPMRPTINRFTGYCYYDGRICVQIRHRNYAKDGGVWAPEPRSWIKISRTVAHEVAHLVHFDHSPEFRDLEQRLVAAIPERPFDRPMDKESLMRRIKKLHEQAKNAKQIGSAEEAAAFAAMVQRLLIRHKIDISDVESVDLTDSDNYVVEEEVIDLQSVGIPQARKRCAWLERLAGVIAEHHNCQHLVCPGTNKLWMVGTESSRAVAIYLLQTIVPQLKKATESAYRKARYQGHSTDGFRESFRRGYICCIRDRLEKMRVQMMNELVEEALATHGPAPVASAPQNTETKDKTSCRALLVLDAEKAAVQDYVAPKRTARGISGRSAWNRQGAAAGRKAARNVPLTTNGVAAKQTPAGNLGH